MSGIGRWRWLRSDADRREARDKARAGVMARDLQTVRVIVSRLAILTIAAVIAALGGGLVLGGTF